MNFTDELYTLTLRALLHSHVQSNSQSEQTVCKGYQLAEHLRQALNFCETKHHDILRENENCIEHFLEVSVEYPREQRFLLEFNRMYDNTCASQEEAIDNGELLLIKLDYGRGSVLRVYLTESDSGDEQRHRNRTTLWCRMNGRANVLMTVKIKRLVVDKLTRIEMPCTPGASLLLTLRERHVSGEDFTSLDFAGLLELCTQLYYLHLANPTEADYEFVFDVLKSVSSFYGFSGTTTRLLALSAILTEDFNEDHFQQFKIALDLLTPALRIATLAKTAAAEEAARLLADRIVCLVKIYLRSVADETFFTVLSESHWTAQFQNLVRDLQPMIEVAHLPFWDLSRSCDLRCDLSGLFERKLQRAVSLWIHGEISGPNLILDDLIIIVDSLHSALGRDAPIYHQFFQSVWLSYLKIAVEMVEDPLSQSCERVMLYALDKLSSHDPDELIDFSKSTMKLFDSLRQFVEFLRHRGQTSTLEKFEMWFETAAVYWTATWRIMYLGFCVDSVDCGIEELECDMEEAIGRIESCTAELQDATVNCLIFFKALCDDFRRLNAESPSILLICSLQIIPMLKTANGIEHACIHLTNNFERFLDLGNVLSRLEADERSSVVNTILNMIVSIRQKCLDMSSKIVQEICRQKFPQLQKHCSQMISTRHGPKKTIRSYVQQVLNHDGSEKLMAYLEKLSANFKHTLLPNLHIVAMENLWKEISVILSSQMSQGQCAEYYEYLDRECDQICKILGTNWSDQKCPLRRQIHLNKADSKELICQYYAQLGDITLTTPTNTGIPRVHLRAGYVHTASRHILLHIYVHCAYDIPILDTLSKSSDPYLRLELYPRHLFPLAEYSPQTTETRMQTLTPKWNQAFQFLIPEELFFVCGASLCITVLDYDFVSYNDLAGQAILPLAQIRKIESLNARHLSPPFILPLVLPTPRQYSEHFQILEKRVKDKIAREVVDYEKHLRSYRMLPATAEDSKESRMVPRSWALENNSQLLQRMCSKIFRRVSS